MWMINVFGFWNSVVILIIKFILCQSQNLNKLLQFFYQRNALCHYVLEFKQNAAKFLKHDMSKYLKIMKSRFTLGKFNKKD